MFVIRVDFISSHFMLTKLILSDSVSNLIFIALIMLDGAKSLEMCLNCFAVRVIGHSSIQGDKQNISFSLKVMSKSLFIAVFV